jgi:hypothetical protein
MGNLVYKVKNLYGGNIQDRFVSESAINEMARDGWKLMSIVVPPNSQNMKHVLGTFVREEVSVVKDTASVAKNTQVEELKRGPGRLAKAQEPEGK